MGLPSPPYYNDFEKPIKDFATVGFSAPDSWKVDVKDKHGSDGVIYCNPTASSQKSAKVGAEIGYNATCGGKIKVNAKGGEELLNSKWTLSYLTKCKQDISVAFQKKDEKEVAPHTCPVEYDITHKGVVQLPAAINNALFPKAPRSLSLFESLSNTNLTVGFGVAAAPHCFFGVGSTYDIKAHTCNWTVSSKYHHTPSGLDAFVALQQLKKVSGGLRIPLQNACSFTKKHYLPITVGVRGSVPVNKPKDLKVDAICEVQCQLCRSNTLKIKVNEAMEVVAAYTIKAAKGWTVALSVDRNLRPGLTLTHA